jgi:universal stress protein A
MKISKLSFAAVVTEAVTPKELARPKQQNILVPIDLCDPSINALRQARELAVANKAQVILLNVVEEPRSFRTLDAVGQRRACFDNRAVRLQELADHELGSQVITHIEVREGDPSVEIARLASKRQVDLILVGRHQHHGLWRWVRGHTASRLSKRAPCPVLLLQPDHLN